jgi:hypothetical protein
MLGYKTRTNRLRNSIAGKNFLKIFWLGKQYFYLSTPNSNKQTPRPIDLDFYVTKRD